MRWIAAMLVMLLCGCSATQVRQEFIGYSMDDVKNSKARQTQQYDISGDECIVKIKEALQEMKAIVREDAKKNFIYADNFQKAFRSSINTTRVGIVITPWENNKTQVDVASGNTNLASFVSKKISEKIKPTKEIPPVVKQEDRAIK